MYLTSLPDNASAPEHEARSLIRRQFILDFILFEMFFTAMIRRESSCLGHNCGFHFSCVGMFDVVFRRFCGSPSRNAIKTMCNQCVTQCYTIVCSPVVSLWSILYQLLTKWYFGIIYCNQYFRSILLCTSRSGKANEFGPSKNRSPIHCPRAWYQKPFVIMWHQYVLTCYCV